MIDKRQRIIEVLTIAMEKPDIANALIQRVINELSKAQPEQEEDYDAIANKQLASLKAAAKVTFEDAVVRAVHKLYNAPPQRESVYCGCGDEIVAGDGARCGTCVAVKFKEKEWVGLTEKEIIRLRHLYDPTAHWSLDMFARAIEAKLKEKNST
jgi:hypothetical protein